VTRSLSTRIKNYQDSEGLNGKKSASTTGEEGKGREGERPHGEHRARPVSYLVCVRGRRSVRGTAARAGRCPILAAALCGACARGRPQSLLSFSWHVRGTGGRKEGGARGGRPSKNRTCNPQFWRGSRVVLPHSRPAGVNHTWVLLLLGRWRQAGQASVARAGNSVAVGAEGRLWRWSSMRPNRIDFATDSGPK